MLALDGLEPWVAAAATTAGLPTPILFGIASGGALVLGALVALIWTPSETAMGLLLAFAGGTILASLADEIFPDAYGDVSSATAIATALGFLMTHLLH